MSSLKKKIKNFKIITIQNCMNYHFSPKLLSCKNLKLKKKVDK